MMNVEEFKELDCVNLLCIDGLQGTAQNLQVWLGFMIILFS